MSGLEEEYTYKNQEIILDPIYFIIHRKYTRAVAKKIILRNFPLVPHYRTFPVIHSLENLMKSRFFSILDNQEKFERKKFLRNN